MGAKPELTRQWLCPAGEENDRPSSNLTPFPVSLWAQKERATSNAQAGGERPPPEGGASQAKGNLYTLPVSLAQIERLVSESRTPIPRLFQPHLRAG